MNIPSLVETAIATATGDKAVIVATMRQSGGSINDAFIVELKGGERYFVKTHAEAKRYPGMFKAEFRALELLAGAAAIRVPPRLLRKKTSS